MGERGKNWVNKKDGNCGKKELDDWSNRKYEKREKKRKVKKENK